MKGPTINRISEAAWLVEWSGGIDLDINRQVHACAHSLRQHFLKDVLQVVPAYNNLLIHFDALSRSFLCKQPSAVEELIRHCIHLANPQTQPPPAQARIPVCFHPSLPNDLEAISTHTGLSIPAIIELFVSQSYHVYLLGFLPGFPYMAAVPLPLVMPRKSQPVLVKAGSVAMAGQQAGIYPNDSPGGWHILGLTPVRLFDANRQAPSFLEPGQSVQFYPVSLSEFHNLNEYPCRP